MPQSDSPSVCVVGAGSMGVITGYRLSQAGATVSFLVRPHRQEQLSRPQKLYSYSDHTLESFTGYTVLTDPSQLAGTAFDFVVITLDGASLRAEAGLAVVDAIGDAYRNTDTGVILGSIGIDLRSWFLQRSGLADTQVTSASLSTLVHEVAAAGIAAHADVRAELLGEADYAYKQLSPEGFTVDLSAPRVAKGFAELYDRSGVSRCSVVEAGAMRSSAASFAPLAAWELLGWPHAADIDPADQTWQLGVNAMAEIAHLPAIAGTEAHASEQQQGNVLEDFRAVEKAALPLDFAAFNAYHHGGKVQQQDHGTLREALRLGEAEGLDMPALRALIARLPQD